MKFLILTQYFYPETGAPQNRLLSLALNLTNLGHNVEVLTALPNYPKMEIFPEYEGKISFSESIHGLLVHRSYIFVSKKKGIFFRLLNYFSFVLSALFSYRRLSHVDYLICESPPLFLGITGLFLSFKLKAKLIFNVSDLWPESAFQMKIVTNKLFIDLAYKLESFIYRHSFLVTGQTQGIISNISSRFPLIQTYWLPNGIDKGDYVSAVNTLVCKSDYGLEDKSTFVYAGLLGYAQGLDVILRAKKWLMLEHPHLSESLQFVIIGDGPDKHRLRELDKHLKTNIIFIDNLPKEDVLPLLKDATACIVPLKNLKLFLGAIPSKIFDPLALGVPIILGVDGEARSIFIDKAKSGLFFTPDDHIELAQSIIHLFTNPNYSSELGINGKKFVDKYFDRALIASALVKHIKSLDSYE